MLREDCDYVELVLSETRSLEQLDQYLAENKVALIEKVKKRNLGVVEFIYFGVDSDGDLECRYTYNTEVHDRGKDVVNLQDAIQAKKTAIIREQEALEKYEKQLIEAQEKLKSTKLTENFLGVDD